MAFDEVTGDLESANLSILLTAFMNTVYTGKHHAFYGERENNYSFFVKVPSIHENSNTSEFIELTTQQAKAAKALYISGHIDEATTVDAPIQHDGYTLRPLRLIQSSDLRKDNQTKRAPL